jgi:hypothetical protein
MSLSWSQALSWRMQRQLLHPVGTASVAGVVRRLGAVPRPDNGAELAIRARRARSRPGEVARALAEGRLIKAYAFRGATHLLTPEEGGAYLALRAASRMWELPSWQSFYRLSPEDWPAFRKAVREALADGPMTREELGAAVTERRTFRHLRAAFGSSDTLLKPLTWQGDMSFGPVRDGRATFQRLDTNPRWAGLPALHQAGRQAVVTYFGAYGPATLQHLQYWLCEGLGVGRRWIRCWVEELGDRLAEVDVGGEPAYVLNEDLAELTATAVTGTVRLLPGYDQWVLGPGTADPRVVPPGRRELVSRGANLVLAGGVVSGTWTLTDDAIVVSWFPEGGRAPRTALAEEAQRLAALLARPLQPRIESARATKQGTPVGRIRR